MADDDKLTEQSQDAPLWRKVRDAVLTYVFGTGVGSVLLTYGAIALVRDKTFLPGQAGGDHFIQGRSGIMLALAYACGGLFLLVRLVLEKFWRGAAARERICVVENALLIVLIGSLIYVLVNVGEVK